MVHESFNYPTEAEGPAYAALTTAQQFAPNGEVQQAFARLYNEMKSAGEVFSEIGAVMLERVADGIRHGNWPE